MRKVEKLSDNNKITVFATSFNDQAEKFKKKIHIAEKEEKAARHTRV